MRQSMVLVMGVSGSGKTTIGAMLAGRLGWTYAEADDFHPPANIAKMHEGVPLTDEDRRPWLLATAAWMKDQAGPAVVTSSALKREYRDLLRAARPDLHLIYLEGTRELIGKRMAARHGHFFPRELLDSQFRDLEPPTDDEHPLVVSIDGPPERTVQKIIDRLEPPASPGPERTDGSESDQRT